MSIGAAPLVQGVVAPRRELHTSMLHTRTRTCIACAAAARSKSTPVASRPTCSNAREAVAIVDAVSSDESFSIAHMRQVLESLYHLTARNVVGHVGNPTEQQGSWSSFSVQLGEPEQSTNDKKPDNKQKSDDYYANVGDAIRTLRAEIPELFNQDLTYGIYRDDIVFRDPRNCFAGLQNYKLIFWSLRFHGRIFFKRLYVDVKRIWQVEDNEIRMRWTVHGIPRIPWEAEGTFDGVSIYKLDSHGKIYEHRVDNVVLRDPPMQRSPLFAGINLIAAPQRQPCPGAWFEDARLRLMAARFSWVRLYASLLTTLQLLQRSPSQC